MKRTLNFKFLGLLLAVAAILTIAGHFAHGIQLKRKSRHLLDQANQAINDKDFPKALGHVSHYLNFHPEDGQARARYGVLLARRAKSHKEFEFAYVTLERALRDAPNLEQALRDDPAIQELKNNADPEIAKIADDELNIRRRIAEIALEMREFSNAIVHLETALKDNPKDAEVLTLMGVCEEALGKPELAAKAYQAAIAAKPSHVDGYVRLAYLLRETQKTTEADTVIEALVKENATTVRARLAAVQYYRQAGQLADARRNLDAAQEGALKDDREVLLAAADLALAEKDEPEARKKLARGLQLYPNEPQFYLVLAGLDLRAGKKADAVKHLRDVVGVLPKQSGEIWLVVDLFIDANERGEARTLVARLRDEKADAVVVDFLEARLLLAEGKPNKAQELLRRNQAELTRKRDLALRTELLLAACYERMGQPDLRLKAARQAASLVPTSLPARLAHASALLAAGKPGEATSVYQGAYASSPQVRFTVARIQIAMGRLKEAGETLDGLPADLKRAAESLLLRALILAESPEKENRDLARKAVEAARDEYPEEPAFWVFLANTSADPKDGLTILDEAQAEAGNGASIRLARANLLVKQKADPAALRALEAEADKLSEAEQTTLALGLSSAHARLGSNADAERLLRQTVDRQSGDLSILFRLFEFIAPKASPEELESLRKKVEEVEGESGAVWRLIDAYKAWREYAKNPNADLLKHAQIRLTEAGKMRPEWLWVPLLQGEIEDRQGRLDAAIEHYQRAIKLGAVYPTIVTRTATLLQSRNRFDDARKLITNLRSRNATLSQELEKLDMRNAERFGSSPEDLIERLERAAPKSSLDYRDHLMRASVFAAANKPKEAEASHRRAIELDSKAPEAWVGLVYFLVRSDRVADAKAEIAKAAQAVPADKRAQALAPCYELIGDRVEAEKQYVEAAKTTQGASTDLTAQRALVAFYISSGENAKAEPILRQLLNDARSQRWARRTLAIVLASGGYAQGTEALALLESNLQEVPGSAEDLRVRSLVRAARPGERGQAIDDLEASFRSIPPSPAEEFLLARMYELDGDWLKAQGMFSSVSSKSGAPVFIAYYVLALLRHKDVAGAEQQLGKLKEKLKEPTPQLVELQARVDAACGRKTDAARAVKTYARETHAAKPNPNLLRAFATLLALLELPDDAEELFREYVAAAEPKDPLAVLVLADFLARHRNKVADALAICEKALTQMIDPDLVALQAVAAVRLGDTTAADFARAEEIIQQAAKAKPKSADIPVSLADLRDAQGRYDDAKEMYRTILRGAPRNTLAMNNLAWLVALHEGKKDEALKWLNDAATNTGWDANLLDTRGVVHLTTGDPAQAIKDLTAAIAQQGRPERYFHLAQAYQKTKNPEAKPAMRKAVELGLSKKDLHKLEWKAYDELIALIDGK